MSPAGYSGTPLPKKLGIKEGHAVALVDAPEEIRGTLGTLPDGVDPVEGLPGEGRSYDVILFFTREPGGLRERLDAALERLDPDGGLWVCWPKKSSPLAGPLDESGVRGAGLATGAVDNKICAVDEDWSGLRFVHRKEDRPGIRAAAARAAG